MKTVENEFNETWEDITESSQGFVEKIRNCIPENDERICLGVVAKVVKDETGEDLPNEQQPTTRWVVEINGGRNGSGDWLDYLKVLEQIFVNLHEHFDNVYFLDLKNDCADDVFYSRVIVSGEK